MLIELIDKEITRIEPAMDDYDGGQVEGLRKARAVVCNTERAQWGDNFCEYQDTGGSF